MEQGQWPASGDLGGRHTMARGVAPDSATRGASDLGGVWGPGCGARAAQEAPWLLLTPGPECWLSDLTISSPYQVTCLTLGRGSGLTTSTKPRRGVATHTLKRPSKSITDFLPGGRARRTAVGVPLTNSRELWCVSTTPRLQQEDLLLVLILFC